MKELFLEKAFRSDSLTTIQQAEEICDAYAEKGYDLSLRQLYYQFVSRNLLQNTEQNYKRLGDIISDARIAGLIDWDMIKDRGRETTSNSHWENPGSILSSAAYSFRLDTWNDQLNHVEVMVEKQALEGVLEPVCKGLDIAFTANKGYSSSSALYETGKRLARLAQRDKDVHIIYLGDHDPSGIDMSRDVFERLSLFSRCGVQVHRVALNMDQVEKYNPPENPAKLTDSRAKGYIDRFGDSSWELDALDPDVLAQIVTDKVISLRDDDLYEAAIAKQEGWKTDLRSLATRFMSGATLTGTGDEGRVDEIRGYLLQLQDGDFDKIDCLDYIRELFPEIGEMEEEEDEE